MKRILIIVALLIVGTVSWANVPVYVWMGWNDESNAQTLQSEFVALKSHGITGVCFNAGFDRERIAVAAAAAKRAGLEYHAWIPCMLQSGKPTEWYAVNRLGVRACYAPAYVDYYTCLDPHNPEVREWLTEQYAAVADIDGVDFVQLDYIRYVDVILARGLWDKYGLVMNEEYPPADYCYCDECTSDFKAQTGIDIRRIGDPTKVKAWAEFRQNVITSLVNKIAAAVHAHGKKISADVFPGPRSHAEWMVRQRWDKWELDAVFPMNYNDFYLKPASWVGKVTSEEVRSVKGNFPVYSGLFICRDWRTKASITDPEGWGLNPQELQDAVRRSLKAGAHGVCLFSTTSMTDEHWQALREVIQE
ncbi:MAG: hypothetical protein J6M53_05215 [Bacteroidaceae bacterium]|nr:hypothetical protein [Bacteroidaceae bacterium]